MQRIEAAYVTQAILTDAEWSIVEPMIPPARHGGRRRSVNVREVLNGIFYVLWTGCQWKALPKDLPPKSTVHDYLELSELGWHVGAYPSRTVCRGARAGRPRSEPDSCDYRLADCEGRAKRGAWLDPSGYDAGKKDRAKPPFLRALRSLRVDNRSCRDRFSAFLLAHRDVQFVMDTLQRAIPIPELKIVVNRAFGRQVLGQSVDRWRRCTGSCRSRSTPRAHSRASPASKCSQTRIIERLRLDHSPSVVAWLTWHFDPLHDRRCGSTRLPMIRIMPRQLAAITPRHSNLQLPGSALKPELKAASSGLWRKL